MPVDCSHLAPRATLADGAATGLAAGAVRARRRLHLRPGQGRGVPRCGRCPWGPSRGFVMAGAIAVGRVTMLAGMLLHDNVWAPRQRKVAPA